jgi:hypothetical protein
LIFFVFVAVFFVKILNNVTERKIWAVRARAIASQLADATDFYFASSFCNVSITCLVTRRATWASALSLFPAASAESATTTNFIFRHRDSWNTAMLGQERLTAKRNRIGHSDYPGTNSIEIELGYYLYIILSIIAIKNPSL